MTERETAFGASRENVQRFLDDCLKAEASQEKLGEVQRMEQLLQERLADPCPVSQPPGRSQSWLLDRLEEQTIRAVSGSVGQALAEAQVPLEVTRDIKECYKERADQTKDKQEQHVHTAIYFGAVARALVSHGRRITRSPAAYLIHSFQVLAGEPWMAPPLRELYLQAQQVCARVS